MIRKIRIQKKKFKKTLRTKNGLVITYDQKLIINCDVYIVTVPTPVDEKNIPDLEGIIKVTKLISRFLSRENIVIYESTFYPGLTEEVFIPTLEKIQNLN